MQFEINGISMGAGTDFEIQAPVDGLGVPPIRTSKQNYSGRDGGIVTGQFFSPRLITITGFILKRTCPEHEAARSALQEALTIREDHELTITLPSGNTYVATVRVEDVQMPYTDPLASRFKIDLLASDPYLYTGEEFQLILIKNVGGGFVLPVTLPIIFSPGAAPTIVNNTGRVEIYPIFQVTGTAHNPEFTNMDTGEKMEFTLEMGVGDVLRIDMRARTATLNGGSVLGLKTADSDWFTLPVGETRLRYETTDVADDGVALVIGRNATTSV